MGPAAVVAPCRAWQDAALESTNRGDDMFRSRTIAAGVIVAASAAASVPAHAATKSCGTVKGVGNGTSVTKVKTTSGTCVVAKSTAKKFARSRVAPSGYTCKERFTAGTAASVTCKRTGRTITFKVVWNGSMPLPPATALPQTG
jgi:hypothetical protein